MAGMRSPVDNVKDGTEAGSIEGEEAVCAMVQES